MDISSMILRSRQVNQCQVQRHQFNSYQLTIKNNKIYIFFSFDLII
ncbi:hypothetical protein HmCmsJML014_02357 [Escherichia coli]|nr:hypothetical protein HmCmsJML014_02357 [Escherichia coli]